jgi:three-Cys-motif partner protein
MPSQLSFGGSWTEDKLDRVQRYLEAYMTILRKHPSLVPVYVDAFAGTGYRDWTPDTDTAQLPLIEFDATEAEFIEGSATRALSIAYPFARYVFVERSRRRAAKLEELKSRFPSLKDRIEIVPEEANDYLQRWCSKEDWLSRRAAVFLDPYGMQVEWPTVECLAGTEHVDLWYLFPLSAVNRLLTKTGKPDPTWSEKLTRIYGTAEWESAFYPTKQVASLFGNTEAAPKDTDFARIAQFTMSRLQSCFPAVAHNPLVLRNERNSPLFLLCFATASRKPSTQKAALNIASYILNM